jgi:hypothetical protein
VHKKGVWNLGLARYATFLAQGVGFQTPFLCKATSLVAEPIPEFFLIFTANSLASMA